VSDDAINAVEMVVGHEAGKVFVQFREPMQRIDFDPRNVIEIAAALTDHAAQVQSGKPGALPDIDQVTVSAVIERHRMTLTQRFAVVLNSSRDKQRVSNGQLGKELAEIALKEIF